MDSLGSNLLELRLSKTTHLHCFLYTSRISPEASASCAVDILKTALNFNKQALITGILVFDGHNFHQYIEGPQPALQELVERIAKDDRHIDFTPRYSEPLGKRRLFTNWSMAYVLLDDSIDDSDNLSGIPGLAAIEKLKDDSTFRAANTTCPRSVHR